MKKRLLLLFLMFCFAGHLKLLAQPLQVSGTVTDASTNEALIGVSVVVKGTTKGTITDANGKFKIEVANNEASLVFTYIGYRAETVAISGKSVINVMLSADITKLEEIVVTGYGTAKKSNLTTSQTTISAKDMEKTENTTVEQALQGRTAGVYVTQNSGQPGGAISVNIRGVSSLNNSTEPLYVIDGVQIQGQQVAYGSQSSSNPLSGLNPSDIADMQILQGPSATALYGSRATNGVILITTKRGKAGESTILYNYSYTLQTPPKHLAVMNLPQYAKMVGEYHAIAGGTTPGEFLDPSLLGKGTDWQKELFNNSAMYKHQLSLTGGNEKTLYYFSGEYMNQDGVALGSGFERYSYRLNLDTKPKEWLSIGTNLSYSQINENLNSTQSDLINTALTLTPQIPVKNIDGTWGGGDNTNGANQFAPVNPIAIASLTTNKQTRRQVMGGVNIDIKLIKGLVFKTSFNSNLGYNNAMVYTPQYHIGWAINSTASYSENSVLTTYWNLNELLNYDLQLGNHNINILASHESQESKWKANSAGRTGYLTNDIFDLNAGDPLTSTNGGGQGDWSQESYLGQLNYSFADRYIISASIRTDGSANFGPENKWGVFPAISGAWRISKEPFYHLDFMNELKLRFETGTTGNQGSQGGIYAPMNTGATTWGTGFLPGQYANPKLKWESTKTNNFGINLGLFQNRIQLEADYYIKSTDNLIMQIPEPEYMGTSGTGGVGNPWVNIGSMENKGWGITLTTQNINSKNFTWGSSFNISGVKTKITKFYNNAAIMNRTSWWMKNWTQQSSIGHTPWQFLGYKQQGIFKSVDEINNSPVPVDNQEKRRPTNVDNVWVGDVKYQDVSGPNGVRDSLINIYDQTYIGNPYPKFNGGFTNTFNYKGLELSVLLTFNYGNDIYNYIAMQNSNPANINLSRNLLLDAENYARLTTDADGNTVLANPGTNLPRITNSIVNGNWDRFTTRWVEDGSYIKVKNISLSYSLPSNLLSKSKIVKSAKLTVSAQNLYTFTHYKGYDPEVGAYVGINATSSNQAIGVDNGRYPLTPNYSFNVLLNF